jgi:hypothetical protein
VSIVLRKLSADEVRDSDFGGRTGTDWTIREYEELLCLSVSNIGDVFEVTSSPVSRRATIRRFNTAAELWGVRLQWKPGGFPLYFKVKGFA